jgi:hypothetical protein
MRIRFLVMAGLAIWELQTCPPAQAVVIFEHVGNTNPATEGFSFFHGAGATGVGGTENGVNYWEGTSANSARYQHQISNSDLSTPGGWKLTWQMKVLNASRPMDAQMSLQDGDGGHEFQVGFVKTLGPYGLGPGAYYRHAPDYAWIQTSLVDPSSDYMTWVTQLDAKGNQDPSDDIVKYYLNGNLLATTAISNIIPFGGVSNAFWGDGNETDPGAWRTSLFRFESFPTLVVPGDFDSDGDVDQADLVVWETHFGTASGAMSTDGDADGDSDVDGADFLVWQRNFAPGPAVTGVPEPYSLLLAAAGALIAMKRRRGGQEIMRAFPLRGR